MEPSLASYLALSGILFTIGTVGVIFKRNALGMFMCIELMLNAVNLTFVAFSRYYADVTGQLFVFMVMSVAAAEAAVGLGIIIAFFPEPSIDRRRRREHFEKLRRGVASSFRVCFVWLV
jgi:NADH-quinone oxidoreductase subunit K